MNTKAKVKRILATLLCIAMILPFWGNAGFAEGSEEIDPCEHHLSHTEDCGYAPAIEAAPCGHKHSEDCGYAEELSENLCEHKHSEDCGYAEAFDGTECSFECDVCAQVPVTLALLPPVSAGSATINLQEPGSSTSALTLSQIDIATEADTGRQFKYAIRINMASYFTDYISPIADTGNKWMAGQAQNFKITIPAELFDENLTVDWDNILISNTGLMEIAQSSAADGIVLQGKQSSNYVSSTYASSIMVRVPVTLDSGDYDAAFANAEISLSGNVVVHRADDESLAPLNFAVDHSIPVVNTNALTPSLVITDADGNAPDFVGNAWLLTGGTYTISGVAQDFEYVKISGDSTVTLDGATINHTTSDVNLYAPAISIEPGCAVGLTLSNTNEVQGSLGYAGIYVAPGATLSVAGDGSLRAVGGNSFTDVTTLPSSMGDGATGYWGGGAGIGGNGIWVYKNDVWVDGSTPSFGTVQINGGSIYAVGGDMCSANVGGGAGIGSGGGSSQNNVGYAISGIVSIGGGSVTAVGGGSQDDSLTGGGAGIGAGGVTGNYFTPYNSAVQVHIGGGAVTATGKADGAGIGGGANVDGGIIAITGGSIVATGGYEDDGGARYGGFGGAGIGGGDMGGVTSISISGGTVVATAIGAAAGVGAGNDGFVGTIDYGSNSLVYGSITISGKADLTATGGSHTTRSEGGAGIGAGRSYSFNNSAGTISILDEATVRAYAGKGAQAIGVGTYYENEDGDVNSLTIEDTVTLWAQNTEGTQLPALLVDETLGDPVVYSSSDVYLTENKADNSAANGYLLRPGTVSEEFPYVLTGTGLTIDGDNIPAAAPIGAGNWATLYRLPRISVSYEFVGAAPESATVPDSENIAPGTAYSSKAPGSYESWVFDGWYTNNTFTQKYVDETVLNEDTVLYGRWQLKSTPIVPTVALYKVEHHKQQGDGSYVLADSDFPLYEKIGETVTAQAKSYEGYTLNSGKSSMSGVVIKPVEEDGELKYLILILYYDMDKVQPTPTPAPTATPTPSPTPIVTPTPTAPAGNSVKTGDESNPSMWLLLMGLSLLGGSCVVLMSTKRKRTNK